MSKRNGDKARTAVQRRARNKQREKTRAVKAALSTKSAPAANTETRDKASS